MPDPTVLLTGVSSGIGLATARYLLDRGWFVYGSIRKGAGPQVLADYEKFKALHFDVTDREAIRVAVRQIKNDGRTLTGVVNNAGIAISGPVETLSEEQYRKQFEVNVFGLTAVIQETLPLLHAAREAGHAPRIVNVSSVSGYLTSPFTTFYSASKFAVEALTDGLRRELLPHGIDVISVAPGPVKTPIWAKGRAQTTAFEDNRYTPMLEKLGPYTEAAEAAGIEPEEVAAAIHRSLTHPRPRPDLLLMRKSWLVKLMQLAPKRMQDRFFLKRLAENRRY
jgi:NAD(P)-dependent dehydrogenase (short-subunit alcohol dehydrogenase family)